MTTDSLEPATPLRRLGAMLYDAFLLIAVLFLVTAIFLPITHGEAVNKAPAAIQYAYRLALVIATVGFFGVFWTRKGRTLGMQVWGIAIARYDGSLPTWGDVIKRLIVAIVPWLPGLIVLGIAGLPDMPKNLKPIGIALLALLLANYAAAWFDGSKRSIHDRFLMTRIVRKR